MSESVGSGEGSSLVPKRLVKLAFFVIGLGMIAVACSSASSPSARVESGSPESESAESESESTGSTAVTSPNPADVYDPVRGGEDLPDGFRQLLGRDAIEPVYDPTFVPADAVDWPEDGLVVGVDLEGEARAYPVGFMTRREMVIDNHRGIPTLVTW